jgi:hypothetical protein
MAYFAESAANLLFYLTTVIASSVICKSLQSICILTSYAHLSLDTLNLCTVTVLLISLSKIHL